MVVGVGSVGGGEGVGVKGAQYMGRTDNKLVHEEVICWKTVAVLQVRNLKRQRQDSNAAQQPAGI